MRVLVFLAALPLVAANPEDVGLSSERLLQMRQMIQWRIDAGELAGAVSLVARRGRIAYFEAQGMADLASGKPMAKDTLFNIASMSKPVTAVAVLMLVEQGRVHLTDPVSRHLPAFRGMKVAIAQPSAGPAVKFTIVPAAREITVQDLLTHTAGLASGPMSKSVVPRRETDETLAAYTARLALSPLEFQPGTRWGYSPAGYDALGHLIEKVSGMEFDAYLKRRILEPLAMHDTFFFVPEDKKPRQATIYRHRDGRLENWANANGAIAEISGAGGHTTTAGDYLAFLQMLLNGGQWNGKRLLSLRSVERMMSPQAPDTLPGRRIGEAWGLGVTVLTNGNAHGSPLSVGSVSHGGNFGTYFWIDPKEKLTAILMTQTAARGSSLVGDFQKAVMQSLIRRE